jgi:hypothetical protein
MPAMSTEPPRAWHEVSIEVGRGDMNRPCRRKAALRDLEELGGAARRATTPRTDRMLDLAQNGHHDKTRGE